MRRLTLFAKGNVDVHDSLHSCRIGGEMRWNGVNEALRLANVSTTVRVRHETCTRSDAILAAGGTIPASIAVREIGLGSYSASAQFSTALFDTQADAVVLSLLPEIATDLFRHRREGYRLYPAGLSSWTERNRAWFRAEFEPLPALSADEAMANLELVVGRIRATRDVPILIYNVSPFVPGETIHCHLGLDETFSTRARRFNLALIELSRQTGISIVDVETVLARHGAGRLKVDAVHLSAEGYEHVARDVVAILDDLGLLERGRMDDAA